MQGLVALALGLAHVGIVHVAKYFVAEENTRRAAATVALPGCGTAGRNGRRPCRRSSRRASFIGLMPVRGIGDHAQLRPAVRQPERPQHLDRSSRPAGGLSAGCRRPAGAEFVEAGLGDGALLVFHLYGSRVVGKIPPRTPDVEASVPRDAVASQPPSAPLVETS